MCDLFGYPGPWGRGFGGLDCILVQHCRPKMIHKMPPIADAARSPDATARTARRCAAMDEFVLVAARRHARLAAECAEGSVDCILGGLLPGQRPA